MSAFDQKSSRRKFLTGAAVASAGAVLMPVRAYGGPPQPPVTLTTDPKSFSTFGFMFPGLTPFKPDADPNVTISNLAALAQTMLDPNVTQPAPGNRDNVGALGSAFTYFGQFVDHDNFRDLQAQPTRFFSQDRQGFLIDPATGLRVMNAETFTFDLSSLYAGGPSVSPQLYASDGVHFLVQEPNQNEVRDLPRNSNGVAQIGDPRNDENELVASVHIMFLKFHNAVVDQLGLGFDDARSLVIKHYQWIVIHQFLPEICGQDIVDGLLGGDIQSYSKPSDPNRPMTPVEVTTAAYRFGHSVVRKAYEVTTATGKLQVFNGTDADLHGGRPLPFGRQIDWGNFIKDPGPSVSGGLVRPENVAHFNFSRFIDTLLSSGLFNLPIGGQSGTEASGSNVLGFRNLVRGFFYGTPSGQDLAKAMGVPVLSPTDALPDAIDSAAISSFSTGTPLWFYILRESELQGGTKIGTLGARLVADAFLGVLRADKNGLLHDNSPDHGGWLPETPIAPAEGQFGLADLAVFAGVATRP